MVFHFIYKTQSLSGKYYIGRHTTTNINDGYLGSGKWIRSIKDKSTLTRTILEYCETFEQLKAAEQELLAEHVGQPDCMNFNTNSCGFAHGKLNPAHLPHVQAATLHRMLTNNPLKDPEARKRASEKQRGKIGPMRGKKHLEETKHKISVSRTGITISDEGRRKLSESRKRDYADGTRVPARAFLGKHHDEETKARVRAKALAREKLTCEHCSTLCTKQNYSRWHGTKCKSYGG